MKMNFKEIIKRFPSLLTILDILNFDDNKALIVGGAVRDSLLGKSPSDIDLATSHSPKEIVTLLRKLGNDIKIITTGINHGTVTALTKDGSFEITSFRKDIICDGRRASVEFVKDITIDAARRDFTINALYYDYKNDNIYDFHGGLDDLKNKKVKFIGDPEVRIKEDYLRILRFFRFSSYYAESIDQEGLDACKKFISSVKLLSPERIIIELDKIIANKKAISTLQVMKNNHFLQEISSDLNWDIDILSKFDSYNIDINVKYSIIFAKNDWHKIHSELFRLRIPNKVIKEIYYFEYYKNILVKSKMSYVVNLILFERKINLKSFLFYLSALNLVDVNSVEEFYSKFSNIVLPDFPINGHDVKNIIPSQDIGKFLIHAQRMWIESDFLLSKEDLLALYKKLVI